MLKAELHREARRKAKVAPRKLGRIVATALPKLDDKPPRGRLQAGPTMFACAIGAASVSHHKREGDRASPAGKFRLLHGFFKPGIPRPQSLLPFEPISRVLGWCDDPASPNYNRPTRLPCRARCESLWRDDGLYEVVIVLDYNIKPRQKNRGSAIFLHCARADFAPTAGCVALRATDLRKLLARLARQCMLVIRS